MQKVISFDQQARKSLVKGADTLARAVTSTLGPRSRNVAVKDPLYINPRILHDGVSVAKNVKLNDPLEDMGATLLREAASKTNDLAGDGTTTATLLANTLLQKGMELVEGGMQEGVIVPKVNPMSLQEWLSLYSDNIVEQLTKRSKKIKTKQDKEKVATISSADAKIGKIVAEAVTKSGDDGLVMVEEGAGFESELEVQEGMQFDNGFLSPYFITSAARNEARYTGGDHYVLLTDYTIADGMQLVPIIEKVIQEGGGKKALLIIADDVVGPALNALVLTKLRSQVPLVAVMAPEYADRRREMLEDLAILTGGVVISKEKQMDLREVKLSDLGRARNILVTKDSTSITPQNPDAEELKERCDQIREQISIEQKPMVKESLKQRLAKLNSSVCIINVGGASQTEIGDRKERVIDAVNATKAAVKDGIIPGGGLALAEIALKLEKPLPEIPDHVHELVQETLSAPFHKLLENSGISGKDMSGEEGIGIDVTTGEQVNMMDAGVVDPVRVTKLAVIHAFSVAGMILTTDCIITDEPAKDVQKMEIVNARQ